jgi:segregation and condensation protein A
MMNIDEATRDGQSDYTFRLEGFEGPLDLLLHLIKKNELNIMDIPISLITEQYLEYIRVMKVLNLDTAGEYLLMASTLLHIKSRMLLPSVVEDGEEIEEDPRAELVRRLLEYQKYKDAAAELGGRPLLNRDVFLRAPLELDTRKEEERLDVSLFELLEAFRKILEGAKRESFHEVTLDTITVEQKIEELLIYFQTEKRTVAFHTLFPEDASLRVLVVTFLAILELVKGKRVRVFQMTPFETIRLTAL